VQVAAWYRDRKTSSGRLTTTSEGDYSLFETKSVMRDGTWTYTVWTRTPTGKDSNVMFSTIGHFCAIFQVCTGLWHATAKWASIALATWAKFQQLGEVLKKEQGSYPSLYPRTVAKQFFG